MRKISYCILFSLLIFRSAFASDSLTAFPLADYYRIILAYHPVAAQAKNFSAMARSEIRTARGAFDPVLKAAYEEKKLNEKNYWNLWQSKLQVPVWFGADLKLAYDNSSGAFLDEEWRTPSGGLTYIGVTVPLGQGLLIDERRATLRQAQQLSRIAEAERVKVVNKLLLEAAKSYWEWYFTYNRLSFHEEALRLAQQRFEAIRERVIFGDLPAIDSLEAFIEVQNRINIRSQSLLEFSNARLIVSNFLWSDQQAPVELNASMIPMADEAFADTLSAVQRDVLLETARLNHPELEKINAKLTQLDIERRWAAEKLRPKLNLDYNFLRSGDQPWQESAGSWSLNNNYKMGLTFSVPLFLREERGKFNLVKLKSTQTEFEKQQLSRDINTSVLTAWNELTLLQEQILVQEAQVLNSARMLEGEQFRFSNGESSIFLINTRENALINSRIKLAELKAKFAKSKAYLYWSAGVLLQ